MKHVKEFLICLTVGLVVGAAFVVVNYYSNVDKNSIYMQATGHELIDGEWRSKEWSEMD